MAQTWYKCSCDLFRTTTGFGDRMGLEMTPSPGGRRRQSSPDGGRLSFHLDHRQTRTHLQVKSKHRNGGRSSVHCDQHCGGPVCGSHIRGSRRGFSSSRAWFAPAAPPPVPLRGRGCQTRPPRPAAPNLPGPVELAQTGPPASCSVKTGAATGAPETPPKIQPRLSQ